MTKTATEISQAYLTDLALTSKGLDIEFLRQLQSKHIAKYSFNSLAVILGQDMPLDLPSLFRKIVENGRGGYCFEHNKLVFDVLTELNFDLRLLLTKVVYKRELAVARTHRVSLLSLAGDDYLIDAGFGPLGPRYPVKLTLDVAQDQGDACYRIIKKSHADHAFQILEGGDFVTLYTFDLHHYNEVDCELSHFYSHQHPAAVFVNNLVICRKFFNDIQSLRNGEFYRIRNGETQVTKVESIEQLYQLLTETFALDLDIAIAEFLYHKFIACA